MFDFVIVIKELFPKIVNNTVKKHGYYFIGGN